MSRVYDFGLGGQIPDSSTKFQISKFLLSPDKGSKATLIGDEARRTRVSSGEAQGVASDGRPANVFNVFMTRKHILREALAVSAFRANVSLKLIEPAPRPRPEAEWLTPVQGILGLRSYH